MTRAADDASIREFGERTDPKTAALLKEASEKLSRSRRGGFRAPVRRPGIVERQDARALPPEDRRMVYFAMDRLARAEERAAPSTRSSRCCGRAHWNRWKEAYVFAHGPAPRRRGGRGPPGGRGGRPGGESGGSPSRTRSAGSRSGKRASPNGRTDVRDRRRSPIPPRGAARPGRRGVLPRPPLGPCRAGPEGAGAPSPRRPCRRRVDPRGESDPGRRCLAASAGAAGGGDPSSRGVPPPAGGAGPAHGRVALRVGGAAVRGCLPTILRGEGRRTEGRPRPGGPDGPVPAAGERIPERTLRGARPLRARLVPAGVGSGRQRGPRPRGAPGPASLHAVRGRGEPPDRRAPVRPVRLPRFGNRVQEGTRRRVDGTPDDRPFQARLVPLPPEPPAGSGARVPRRRAPLLEGIGRRRPARRRLAG